MTLPLEKQVVKKDCGFFNPHEWTKWEQRSFQGQIESVLFRYVGAVETFYEQIRYCVKCGKKQREEI